MIGILVHGDNHFIVEGPLPDHEGARRLVRSWEVPAIGWPSAPASANGSWKIVTRAFRENLEWAVVLRAEAVEPQPAVMALLDELAARGIRIHTGTGPWLPIDPNSHWEAGGDAASH